MFRIQLSHKKATECLRSQQLMSTTYNDSPSAIREFKKLHCPFMDLTIAKNGTESNSCGDEAVYIDVAVLKVIFSYISTMNRKRRIFSFMIAGSRKFEMKFSKTSPSRTNFIDIFANILKKRKNHINAKNI